MTVSTGGQLWTRVSDTILIIFGLSSDAPTWENKVVYQPYLVEVNGRYCNFCNAFGTNRFGRLSISMRRMVGFQGLTSNGKRTPHQSFLLVHGGQSTVKWPPTERSIGMTTKNCESKPTFVWETLLTDSCTMPVLRFVSPFRPTWFIGIGMMCHCIKPGGHTCQGLIVSTLTRCLSFMMPMTWSACSIPRWASRGEGSSS